MKSHSDINETSSDAYFGDIRTLIPELWSVSAQLKAFMDRCYALGPIKDSFTGKKAALLMTYGGELPNKGPELVKTTFEEICDYKEMDLIDVYGVCTEDYMPVAENVKALRDVYEMGLKVLR